ncbi:MAG: hypothetical protein E6772_16625 [Dysgonomonas sp.]|nr:hypothetical protein [Dysgonomonas sp.]
METKKIDREDKKHVRIQSLADKYDCSRQYVAQILDGESPLNSPLSQKIMMDAIDIVEIIKRITKITL